MSNLIKAYSIRYSEDARVIDLNQKSEELESIYAKKNNIPRQKKPEASSDGFMPGLFAEQVEVDEEYIGEPYEDNSGYYEDGAEPEYEDDAEYEDGAEGSDGEYSEDYGEEAEEFEALSRNATRLKAEQEASNKIIDENQQRIEQQMKELENLKDQADVILEDARNEVKKILAQAAVDAESEKKRLFEEAKIEGYKAGIADGEAEIAGRLEEIEQQRAQYAEEYEEQVKAIEPAFVEMVIKFVRKLTGVYAIDKREIIMYQIEQALSGQEQCKSCIIHVSTKDYEFVRKQIDRVRAGLSEDAVVEVFEDRMLNNKQCLIETESRVFDCSLDVQLEALSEDLRLLTMNTSDLK